MKVGFIGDISLNNKYNSLYSQNINPFIGIEKHLEEADFIVGNLECVSEGITGENLLRAPRLKTKVETLNYLKKLNLGIVTLAHNHVFDNLEDGFDKTLTFLNNNNINYLGAGKTEAKAEELIIIESGNLKIGFLNYVDLDTNPNLLENSKVYLNYFNLEKAKAEIREHKEKVDHLVCLLHWGGKCEGGYYPDWDQPKIAYSLIESGVDLIIGTHSHTLQPYEIYNGKYIFYSLGNFCFSDVVSDGKTKEIQWNKCTESIILIVYFSKNEYKVEFVPINSKNLILYKDDSVIRKWEKRNRKFKVIKTNKRKWNKYYFFHKNVDPVMFYFFGNNHNFLKQLFKISPKKIVKFLKKQR